MRKIKSRILWFYRTIKHHRGLWLRGALCWALGIAFLVGEGSSNFDLRFQLRGVQKFDQNIVLIDVSPEEWARFTQQSFYWRQLETDLVQITDDFFWNPSGWQKVLTKALNANPRKVIVSFYFDHYSRRSTPLFRLPRAFTDERVYWAERLSSEGHPIEPSFVQKSSAQVGLLDLPRDADGIVRRFTLENKGVPHLALQAVSDLRPDLASAPQELSIDEKHRLINFQGPAGTYQRLSFSDLISENINSDFLTGKTVIFGSLHTESHIYHTPLGRMARSEILANLIDNLAHRKSICRLNLYYSSLLLLALLIFSIGIMSSYPQSIAAVFLFWLGISGTAFSLWMFDSFYYWIPIVGPLAQLIVTFVVFLSFQLTVREYQNLRLEQQREYLLEVEQLKNNFVSLISHDLKTPIAKIQGICDRLLSGAPKDPLAQDLRSLRQESTELHKYIQSILQISRIESRDFKLNKDPTDLNEVIEKALSQLKPLAAEKHIRIHTSLEPMFSLDLDPILIREVILNIVENAIKYTPERGLIKVTTKEEADRVIFEVKDSGPGIPEEDQSRIFDKFYRGSDQKRTTKGSGLGLYLVKYFIELHGGKVHLYSEPGQGTRLGFSLPVLEEVDTEHTYSPLALTERYHEA